MTADNGMEDIQALIPNVVNGRGRQCGRDHTIRICGEEEPAYRRYETECAQREREAQRISVLSRMQQLQCKSNNNQLKVTRSVYIVTHLGQLPFMLFTQMARTWAIQEDSGNTSIIHWYSTFTGVSKEDSRRIPIRRLRQSLKSSRYDWSSRTGCLCRFV